MFLIKILYEIFSKCIENNTSYQNTYFKTAVSKILGAKEQCFKNYSYMS